MSIGAQFKQDLRAFILADATITGLIVGRLYASRAPQKPTSALMVWTTVSSSEEHAHDGPMGLEEFKLQFSIYATTTASVEAIRDALKERLNGIKGPMGSTKVGFCLFDNDTDQYQNTTKLKHKIVDFRFMLESA